MIPLNVVTSRTLFLVFFKETEKLGDPWTRPQPELVDHRRNVGACWGFVIWYDFICTSASWKRSVGRSKRWIEPKNWCVKNNGQQKYEKMMWPWLIEQRYCSSNLESDHFTTNDMFEDFNLHPIRFPCSRRWTRRIQAALTLLCSPQPCILQELIATKQMDQLFV